MVRLPEAYSDHCSARRSRATYTQFQNYLVIVPEAGQTAAEQGEAEVRILNFKTTWSEF